MYEANMDPKPSNLGDRKKTLDDIDPLNNKAESQK